MYIGPVFVKKSSFSEITNKLLNTRYCCDSWENVDKEEKHFAKDNRKVHYTGYSSADKFHIAKRWLDLLEEDNSIKLKVSGLELEKMDYSNFGERKSDSLTRIYAKIWNFPLQLCKT